MVIGKIALSCCHREPHGTNTLIKIPELKVSKVHAVIAYDKHEQGYMVTDQGSANGTFLNKDQRLSKVRKARSHATFTGTIL